jgi:hypothetical protein
MLLCCLTIPVQVHWHASLDAVPNNGPAIYIAHEFLDALPVHQFVRDPRRGWLEVREKGAAAAMVSTLQMPGLLAVVLLYQFMKDPRRGWVKVRYCFLGWGVDVHWLSSRLAAAPVCAGPKQGATGDERWCCFWGADVCLAK